MSLSLKCKGVLILKTNVFAHRGSAGTHPENTMAAFIEAYKVGADGIELDVQLTKDNKLAVIHDGTVDRTTNGKGKVRDFTLNEIQKLSAGLWFSSKYKEEKIPSLTEVLKWIKGKNIKLNIEVKYAATDFDKYEEVILKEVKAYDLEKNTIISSFNHDGLKKIHHLNPQIEIGILYLERLYEPWNYAKTLGAKALHSIWTVTDEEMIKNSIKNGSTVRVYTVNKKDQLKHFMIMRCPAIITDYPERAISIRKEIQSESIL